MTITLHSKSNYGNLNWYVRDEVQAKAIARLTGKKTVSASDVDALAAIGVRCVTFADGKEFEALPIMRGLEMAIA